METLRVNGASSLRYYCRLVTSHVLISAASWRTWSLAVRAMALLVQPMVRVPLQAPSPPSSLPAGPPQAAPVPVPLSPPSPPMCFHSHHPCPLLPFHLPQQQLAWLLPLQWSPSRQPSRRNTFSPQLHLEPRPHRNVASSPAGLVHLLLRLLLLDQVRFCRLISSFICMSLNLFNFLQPD